MPSIHSPLLLVHLHLRQPLPYHLALLQVSPHSVGPAAMDPPLDTLLSRLTACVDSLCKGEFTLLQSEMKLALTWPSCSADLRVLWTTLHSS